VFDGTKCSCDPSKLSTFEGESKCVGTQIADSIKTIIGTTTCNYWQSAHSCPGEKICNDVSGNYDYCSCEKVNTCTSGSIKCLNTTHYQNCQQTTDINSCYKFRGTYSVDIETQKCDITTNKIVARSDIGCAFNSPGYACSTLKDARGILLEKCVGTPGVCTITSDSYSATESQYTSQNTKCFDNSVYYVKKYTDKKDYFRWEIKTNAEYSESGVCKTGFHCASDGTNGRCFSDNEFMNIDTANSYAVNQPIINVKIQLTNKVTDKGGLPSIIYLTEDGDEIPGTRITNKLTNPNGLIYFNYTYSHPRVSDITLEVIVGDPNGVNYKGSKTITIAKTSQVRLTCPLISYVERPITCSFSIIDATTNQILSGTKTTVSLKQGGDEIRDYDLTSNSLTFETQTAGSVELQISASKDGYLADVEKISLSVDDPVIGQEFLVDNKDYSLYTQLGGISTGSHTLTLKIDESGNPIELTSINAKVQIPSGGTKDLTFTQSATDDLLWTTNYNFADSGRTYVITGEIVPKDYTKEIVGFEYSLTTVGTSTEDLNQQKKQLVWIVVGIVFAIAVLILMVVLIRRKR